MQAELFSLCTWLASLDSKLNWAHHNTELAHVSGSKKGKPTTKSWSSSHWEREGINKEEAGGYCKWKNVLTWPSH